MKMAPTAPKDTVRILFADDEPDIRELTSAQLQRNGHDVVAKANGETALQAFRGETFDVVLLDEEMPRMSGTQVLLAIREQDAAAGTRTFVVAFTGNNSPEDTNRLLTAGFNAVLGKPFRMDALKAVLPAFGFAAPASIFSSETAASGGNATEMTLLDRANGDEKLLRKMIRTFLKDTPMRMSALGKSLARKDAEAARSVAHALKGSISIFAPESAAARAAAAIQAAASGRDFPTAGRHYTALKEDVAKLEVNLRGYAKQPKVKSRVRGKKAG